MPVAQRELPKPRAGKQLGGPLVTPRAKVRSPVPRRREPPRERLVGELALAQTDLLLVLASAGFGKTVTISQWAGSAERPVVWATVTGADSDPVVLISTLLAAFDAAGVRGTAPSSPLTGDEPAFSRRVLPQFLRSVEQVDLPVTMVVDDVHDMTGVRPAVVLTALLDALTAVLS